MFDNVTYWVASNGDAPLEIWFNWPDANGSGAKYLDGFDAWGAKVVSLTWNGIEYTEDF